MLKKLVKFAEIFDQRGETKKADAIEKLLSKLASPGDEDEWDMLESMRREYSEDNADDTDAEDDEMFEEYLKTLTPEQEEAIEKEFHEDEERSVQEQLRDDLAELIFELNSRDLSDKEEAELASMILNLKTMITGMPMHPFGGDFKGVDPRIGLEPNYRMKAEAKRK